jgi:RNA polymerase sigma-70 factor (ECF subfamily)
MTDQALLVEQFDQSRSHLRAAAFRMLGSVDEADDAVQETWLRASGADSSAVANVTGWLTTIIGRVCLDMLRSRRRRSEEFADTMELEMFQGGGGAADPIDEAVLAEDVGLALLVVLDTLSPAERIAFVMHDLFAVPFDLIAPIVERSPVTTKKLASRARRRVQGSPLGSRADLVKQRQVVEAFLSASRAGDLNGLLAVLDPDVVRRADPIALQSQVKTEIRGARLVAEETVGNAARARFARVILVDGAVGAVVAPHGRALLVLKISTEADRVTEIDVVADRSRLSRLSLAVADTNPL